MLKNLRLENFKSFANANLRIGAFTILIGPNASGKSNVRDAFRFLHGIGRGYTLSDIIGGKYGAGGQSEWSQMRGAAGELVRFGKEAFTLSVDLSLGDFRDYIYAVTVERQDNIRLPYIVTSEKLCKVHGTYIGDYIYTSHPGYDDLVESQDDESHLLLRMAKTGGQRRLGARVAVRPDQPAISQLGDLKAVVRQHKDIIDQVMQQFASIRFLDLVPDQMRQPSFPGQTILGDAGDNLPTVLQEICSVSQRKNVLTDWLRELTPLDVIDFEFPVNPVTGLVQLQLKEVNGNTISSYSASDGTLRFLAMLAALLGSNPARLYFFEEIDNGIHPTRLRLLLDLIERQTRKSHVQVVTTTHSPDLLSMVGTETYENISVVNRRSSSDDSIIRTVSSLAREADGVDVRSRLRELHSSGWIEDVLQFEDTNAENEAQL